MKDNNKMKRIRKAVQAAMVAAKETDTVTNHLATSKNGKHVFVVRPCHGHGISLSWAKKLIEGTVLDKPFHALMEAIPGFQTTCDLVKLAPGQATRMATRPGRDIASRIVDCKPTLTNVLNVILIKMGPAYVLATVYGGGYAPREVAGVLKELQAAKDAKSTKVSELEKALEESKAFWAEHALSEYCLPLEQRSYEIARVKAEAEAKAAEAAKQPVAAQ